VASLVESRREGKPSVTRTVSRKPLVSLGVAACLVAPLAGCGSVSAGAAAVAGGHRISVADVQAGTADAQKWVGQGVQVVQAQVLYLIAVAPYVQEIASRYGAGASADDARTILKDRVPKPSGAVISVIRANISLNYLQSRLGEKQAAEVLTEATHKLAADGFEVNPRFGRFHPENGRILLAQPNWLVSSPTQPGDPASSDEP
jgi:hypothetical protein